MGGRGGGGESGGGNQRVQSPLMAALHRALQRKPRPMQAICKSYRSHFMFVSSFHRDSQLWMSRTLMSRSTFLYQRNIVWTYSIVLFSFQLL